MTSLTLLQGKLHPPQSFGPSVPRPMLLTRLDRSLDVALTLITAPAGAGKTRLLTDWIQTRTHPVAWVALDAADTDPARFVTYVIAAIQTVYPDATRASRMMLNLPTPLSADGMAEALLQDLGALPGPLLLVLDDYHLADSDAIRDVLQRVLHMPPSDFHLILATRLDPSLPLARLRTQFQLLEVRYADLRFSPTESACFLESLAGRPVDPETATLLHDYTEGWAVGLQLAGILLQNTESQRGFAAKFTDQSHHWIAEYLVDEVIAKLPAALIAVMLRSALFERFSASLLEAALAPAPAPGHGEEFIAFLVDSNLFVSPLDDAHTWYRYHHLFRDLLLQSLNRNVAPAEVRRIHQQAGAWFEDHGLIDDAVRHAQAAHEEERTIRLIETNLYRALNEEDVRQLDRWLNPLPEPLRRRPAILVAQAYRQQWRFQMDALPPLLDEAESGLVTGQSGYSAEECAAWQGAIASLRALMLALEGEGTRSLEQSALALRLAPPTWRFVRGLAELSRAFALGLNGDPQAAVAFCRRSLAESSDAPNVQTLRLLLALCGTYYSAANADEIVSAAATYLLVAEQLNRSISVGWARFAAGWGHYQHNNLEAAEANFRALVAIRHGVHMRALVDGYTGLALTLAAQGRPHEALAAAHELSEFLTEIGALSLLHAADSLVLRLRLMQGERIKIPSSGDLVQQFRNELWELPVFTAVRACIESGASEQMERAGALLALCREQVERKQQQRQCLELELLCARYHTVQGDADAAMNALARALAWAHAGGIVRMFLDEGPSLIPCLTQLVNRNRERAYALHILAAFDPKPPRKPMEGATGLRPAAGAGRDLTTVLTFREMDILALVTQHKSNQEIAEQLVITLSTVKRHTNSIFKKLEVSNRREAAARALALGLVPPSSPPHPAPGTGERHP